MKRPQTFTYKAVGRLELLADVYSSDTPNGPVVLFLHGGALIWGSRVDLPPVFLDPLLADGHSVVSIDYRLAPATKISDILTDVGDALGWIQGGCGGQVQIDASRIAVAGTSAGGYLALSSGTFPNRPKVIVSFYGYGSIAEEWYARPSDHYLKLESVSDTEFHRWVNSSEVVASADFDRFPYYVYTRQRASWVELVLSEKDTDLSKYCPIENVDQLYPPTFFAHGTDDADVPHTSSQRMCRKLQDRSIATELHLLEGYGHVFEQDDRDPNVQNAINRMRLFLSRYL